MIRFVTPELEALFCEKSVQFGIFGAKIYSQYQTYGAQSGILDMWLLFDDTYVTGCVSRFGGLLTAACTPRADVEELAVFLRAVGGRAVEGMLPLIERVRAVTRQAGRQPWLSARSRALRRGRRALPRGPSRPGLCAALCCRPPVRSQGG